MTSVLSMAENRNQRRRFTATPRSEAHAIMIPVTGRCTMAADQVKALIYDVFGTVVDWRSSVIREGKALGEARGVQVDWSQFADEWRKVGYVGAIQKIHRGDLPFTTCD